MTTEEKLDETDIRILKLLQQNSRLTVKELAARVHLSPSPTFERQKRLEREGYIQRYGAIVDHHKLGHNVIVLCNIRLKQHTHDLIQQFMDIVQTIDQITECYNTTGDYDFQIKVYARDMKAYQDFMLNTLGNIDCIGSLHSIIVIGEIRLKQHTHDLIQQFMDTVQTIDQITECYNTTGDYDFQIKVYARDMKAYQDFMLNTLGNIDCIGSLHSIIVIGEIKDSHYIPVAK